MRAVMFGLSFVLIGGGGSGPATPQDYRELVREVRGVQESLEELATALGGDQEPRWQQDCRGYSPEKTVRCAAAAFGTSAAQAISIWQCESGWGIEPGSQMGHSYHGPFQYLYLTYEHQQESMPDLVRWFELSPAVHDPRSNILTAVAWAARHGWGPWGCA